jgi:hypothetical protein
MTIGLVFWIIMLLWFLYAIAWHWGTVPAAWAPFGNAVLLFILFLLLGWHAFGAPVHG